MKKLLSVLLVCILAVSSLTIFAHAGSVDLAEEAANIDDLASTGATTLLWPVEGHTSLSRNYASHNNKAIDISDSKINGANVKAAIGGIVQKKFTCTQQHSGSTHTCYGYGTGLAIKGDDGRFYCYGHFQSGSIPKSIEVGSRVNTGNVIGKVGSTGNSSGAHLHFEICKKFWPNSDFVNPQKETYIYSFKNINYADLGAKFYANVLVTDNKKLAMTSNTKNNVYISTLNYSNYQKWLFERQSDKSYKITNIQMNMCLDLVGNKSANNTNVQVYKNNGSNAQRWFLVKNGSGYSFLPKSYLGSAIDINGGKLASGTNLKEYTGNMTAAQRFTIVKTVDYKDIGTNFNAKINSVTSGFSVAANSKANVYLEKTANNTYQKWKFERQSDMTYKITNVKTGKCLDVNGAKTANGTNVQVWKSNNSAAQRWYIVPSGKNYLLIPKCNLNGALDINGAKFKAGTNIQEWTRNTSNAQKFNIVKV